MNRQLTGRIATYHFTPTTLSRQNLLDEGISEDKIIVTGNTVIDALHMIVKKLKNSEPAKRRLVLITGHRRENFGKGFINICNAIKALASKYPDVDFVYPMHLNPNVRKPIHEVFGDDISDLGNVSFIEPLEYLEFVQMMQRSCIVLTDSGGIQEEAPGLGKPVLVMRDTTERPEAVEAGTVKLVGTDKNAIVNGVSLLLDNTKEYQKMSQAVNPYGDGKACGRIVAYFSTSQRG